MRTPLAAYLCLLIATSACTYHTSVSVTKNLAPGMSAQQVRAVMGSDPSQTQFVADKWVWKYWLAQWGTGNIPYYLVFNKDSQTLEAWVANEAEFARNQQMWMQTWSQINQTFPPKQKYEVKIKRK